MIAFRLLRRRDTNRNYLRVMIYLLNILRVRVFVWTITFALYERRLLCGRWNPFVML